MEPALAPPAFDVSGLVAEARPIALAAAEVYWRHTQRWFVGLACFGSAARGGVIPGVSDLDLHLYLDPVAFVTADGHDNVLPLDLLIAIQRDLARIDPHPFAYIDGGAETDFLPPGHIGPVPGTYHLIAGRLPIPAATNAALKQQAQAALAELTPLPAFVSGALLQHSHSRGELAPVVRAFCQEVWPAAYQAACLAQADAIAAWQMPKPQLVAAYPIAELRPALLAFDAAMRRYYAAPEAGSLEDALATITAGVRLREAIAGWAARSPRAM